MASPADTKVLTEVYHITGRRIKLRHYESVKQYKRTDDNIGLVIETYEVQELVREDRYLAGGQTVYMWHKSDEGWNLDVHDTFWDELFEPYTYEKFGRRKTAEETHEQREWEKLCYRPGTRQTPLDSYDRVCDPTIRSTDRMERHF